MRRITVLALLMLMSGACGSRARTDDPIDGVSPARQRRITRTELSFEWPLVPGVGTIGCTADGVILFRAGGVTYAVQGHRPGAADIAAVRVPEPSALPSNPVKRLKQDVRMDAFASLMRCGSGETRDARCYRDALERFGVSADEARLIETEGEERKWPPLARGLMPLDPLVDAGRALCGR